MSARVLEIHELAAWGFDHETDRPSLSRDVIRIAACKAQRKPHQAESPVSVVHPRNLARRLASRGRCHHLRGRVGSDRDNRRQCRTQPVANDDLRPRQAFRRRRTHVVRAEHLEEGRPRETLVRRSADQRDRQPRQEQVLKPADGIVGERDETCTGKEMDPDQMQVVEEDDQQQLAE